MSRRIPSLPPLGQPHAAAVGSIAAQSETAPLAGLRNAARSLRTRFGFGTTRRRCGFQARAADCLEARQMLSGVEYRSIDGTGNNLADPDQGSAHESLIRLAASDYGDGVSSLAGADRASAREISNLVAAQTGDDLNESGRTDFLWLWGQFLDHDLDLTEGADPEEPAAIEVPVGDAHFDPFFTGTATIDLSRSVYDESTGVREQINEITAYIDGSNVYGSDAVRAAALRTFDGGRLKVTETADGDLLPFNVEGLANAGGDGETLFLAGDVRANENIYLTAMHTLWVREHNRIADEIAGRDPHASDETIYQEARRQVVAELQAITYNEWLPALLGANALSRYDGYDAAVDASIANEFSTAAFRFGHSLLPSTLFRIDENGTRQELELRDAFFRPDKVAAFGVDSLLAGAAEGLASDLDGQVVDDLRNFLFGPPGAGGFDLVSLNIQRGRDHGLASYNDTREALGLGRVGSFGEISSDADVVADLQAAYDSVDDIDLWVGGLAEDAVAGSMLGATFHTIVVDQFERLRDGDRFWYERDLSPQQARRIGSTQLADVISRNTDVELRGNVFIDEAQAKPQEKPFLVHDHDGGRFLKGTIDAAGRSELTDIGSGPGVDVPMLTGDFDGDGDLDIATLTTGGRIWLRMVEGEAIVGYHRIDPPNAADSETLVADLDGDGADDLVSIDRTNGRFVAHQFDGRSVDSANWGQWYRHVPFTDITIGDFDGDDRDDILGRNALNGDLVVMQSTGHSLRLTSFGTTNAAVPWADVQATDLDGDGRDDFVGRNRNTGAVWAGLSDGERFRFQKVARFDAAQRFDELRIGDFNGDGADDFLMRDLDSGRWYCTVSLIDSMDGDDLADLVDFGRWTPRSDWTEIQIADYDGDGADDLVGVHENTDRLFALLGGAGGFDGLEIGRMA